MQFYIFFQSKNFLWKLIYDFSEKLIDNCRGWYMAVQGTALLINSNAHGQVVAMPLQTC
jgi:hypothetical protein